MLSSCMQKNLRLMAAVSLLLESICGSGDSVKARRNSEECLGEGSGGPQVQTCWSIAGGGG
jgi:hypothetical protein